MSRIGSHILGVIDTVDAELLVKLLETSIGEITIEQSGDEYGFWKQDLLKVFKTLAQESKVYAIVTYRED